MGWWNEAEDREQREGAPSIALRGRTASRERRGRVTFFGLRSQGVSRVCYPKGHTLWGVVLVSIS